ncbi:MAG TPA: peroxiredoxin, partial [Acidimicrobiia bacterium]|nr:peroxiredoxin [Acidimicrobiia bacterium]
LTESTQFGDSCPMPPEKIAVGEAAKNKRIIIFGLPGAFTPTCSDHHLPGFVMQADEILAKGVDRIACIAVNDAFVMGAWGNAQGTGAKITMLADGSGEFTAAAGLELDLSGPGLGTRSQRYAAILEDGVVQDIFVESDTGVNVSSADAVLKAL